MHSLTNIYRGLCPLILPPMLMGCANNYMPLDDYALIFNVVMPSKSAYGVDVQTMICSPDLSTCGRRKVDADLYDPDISIAYLNGDESNNFFEGTGYSTAEIEAGSFNAFAARIGPGQHIELGINDFPMLLMDVLPDFQITEPAWGQVIHLSSGGNFGFEWSPSMKGFPMRFRVFPADNDLEISPCDALSWGSFEGEGEDTGRLDIPSTFFPADLPTDGCDVVGVVTRDKIFDLPKGISGGFARSSVVDYVVFRVLP